MSRAHTRHERRCMCGHASATASHSCARPNASQPLERTHARTHAPCTHASRYLTPSAGCQLAADRSAAQPGAAAQGGAWETHPPPAFRPTCVQRRARQSLDPPAFGAVPLWGANDSTPQPSALRREKNLGPPRPPYRGAAGDMRLFGRLQSSAPERRMRYLEK